MPRRGRTRPLTRAGLLATAGLLALSACGGQEAGPRLELSAALPDAPADGTTLRVGDPATEVALKESGLIDDLDVDVEWANITGGPKTLEAFRADAIDIGSVADIPPLFAHWTGTDVRIVAARETVDPEDHPTYELGVAPGVDVKSIEDLKGKKIAYSPGQAQGALVLNVLREAGLTQDDVEFVEMQSVDDAFSVALAGKQVDVAPLGQFTVPTSWDDFIARHQQTVDTLVEAQDQEPLDVETIYDRRFEKAIAAALSDKGEGSQ
jgi:sulfonate transport system substrate-binding protein